MIAKTNCRRLISYHILGYYIYSSLQEPRMNNPRSYIFIIPHHTIPFLSPKFAYLCRECYQLEACFLYKQLVLYRIPTQHFSTNNAPNFCSSKGTQRVYNHLSDFQKTADEIYIVPMERTMGEEAHKSWRSKGRILQSKLVVSCANTSRTIARIHFLPMKYALAVIAEKLTDSKNQNLEHDNKKSQLNLLSKPYLNIPSQILLKGRQFWRLRIS